MKHLLRMAAIIGLALAAAGLTWLVKGPPERGVACAPAMLKPDEICLSRVMTEWRDAVLWVDARSRAEWNRKTVAGAALWNFDAGEDVQAFEAGVAMRLADGRPVVVFCASESCGVSRQVAESIRKLDMGNEVKVLYGGWRALQAAGAQGPPLGAGGEVVP
jgi:rhodanese-related sulfurtransferase